MRPPSFVSASKAGAALGGVLLALAAAAQTARPIAGTYICVDAKGNTLTSDRPIPACADREQRVLGPTGTVRARIAPPLTAQQRAEQEARQRAEAEARAQEAEARRLDKALLVRYPNAQAHERERAEALSRVKAAVTLANERIASLQAQQRKVDEEMEFYRKDPSRAPAPLRAQQADIARGMDEQRRFIEAQEAEHARIDQRFDEELERLKVLWTGTR